jgi:hypothetical protein
MVLLLFHTATQSFSVVVRQPTVSSRNGWSRRRRRRRDDTEGGGSNGGAEQDACSTTLLSTSFVVATELKSTNATTTTTAAATTTTQYSRRLSLLRSKSGTKTRQLLSLALVALCSWKVVTDSILVPSKSSSSSSTMKSGMLAIVPTVRGRIHRTVQEETNNSWAHAATTPQVKSWAGSTAIRLITGSGVLLVSAGAGAIVGHSMQRQEKDDESRVTVESGDSCVPEERYSPRTISRDTFSVFEPMLTAHASTSTSARGLVDPRAHLPYGFLDHNSGHAKKPSKAKNPPVDSGKILASYLEHTLHHGVGPTVGASVDKEASREMDPYLARSLEQATQSLSFTYVVNEDEPERLPAFIKKRRSQTSSHERKKVPMRRLIAAKGEKIVPHPPTQTETNKKYIEGLIATLNASELSRSRPAIASMHVTDAPRPTSSSSKPTSRSTSLEHHALTALYSAFPSEETTFSTLLEELGMVDFTGGLG